MLLYVKMSFQILAKSVLAICLVNLVMDLRSIKDKSEVVSTSQGPTRGEIWTSKNGRPFSHFRSVPYAKPPVGKKRFKLPQPLGSEDRGWRRGLFSSSHLYAVVNTTVPTTCHRLHSRRWLSWRRIAGQRAKLLPGSRHSSSFYPIPPRNSWIS